MTPAQAIVKLAELGLPTEKLAAALAVLEAMEEGIKAPLSERRQKDRERKQIERASKDVQGNPRTQQDSAGQEAVKGSPLVPPLSPAPLTPPIIPPQNPPSARGDDVSQAFAAWNVMADRAGLPSAQKLTASRKSKLTARLRDCGGLDGWSVALGRIRGSPFLNGDNDRGWKADLDFMLQESSFVKLMEGSYDDRTQNRTQRGKATGNSRAENKAIVAELIREAERREAEAGGDGIRDVDARAA